MIFGVASLTDAVPRRVLMLPRPLGASLDLREIDGGSWEPRVCDGLVEAVG
jgi:hypothetical protein